MGTLNEVSSASVGGLERGPREVSAADWIGSPLILGSKRKLSTRYSTSFMLNHVNRNPTIGADQQTVCPKLSRVGNNVQFDLFMIQFVYILYQYISVR